MPVVAGCPAVRSHACADGGVHEPMLLLFSKRALGSWGGCGCTMTSLAHAWPEAASFPLESPTGLPRTAELSAWGYTDVLSTCLALGCYCFSLLLELLFVSVHHTAFLLLFFLVSSFFFVCRLPPLPLHSSASTSSFPS